MCTSVELPATQEIWTPPKKPFDEAAWQAWIAKGREQDRRRSAAFAKGVKWTSIAALLAAIGYWPHNGPYDIVVRFIVAAGAMAMIFEALRSKYCVIAAVFGALVLLYNPVAPLFSFSGQWQSGLVVASAVPFVASLAWRNARMEPDA
jgi:hypothetical protein